MIRFVWFVRNNEGGQAARIVDGIAALKDAIRGYLLDPEMNPPLDEEERREMEADLADITDLDGCYPGHEVRGSQAWKEWIVIAPLADD